MFSLWFYRLATKMEYILNKVYVMVMCCVTLLVVTACGMNHDQQYNIREEVRNFQLVEDAMAQVVQNIEAGNPKKIVFDEETMLAMEYYDIQSLFVEAEIREVVASKLAQLYEAMDVDGLMAFLAFLDVNQARFLAEDDVYDICFSEQFISTLKMYISANGVHEKTEGETEIYTYHDAEVWLVPYGCYIKFAYLLDGEERSGTVLLGNTGYRLDQHTKYDESSPGYFLVGDQVELVEDVIESSKDLQNKYYPAARCPKCGNSFRANTLRARMIANHGYCGMGLCNND